MEVKSVAGQYLTHLASLGFEVFKSDLVPGPWSFLAEREMLRVAFYAVPWDYSRKLELMQVKVVRIIEELIQKQSSVPVKPALLLARPPDTDIFELIAEFNLPAVWPDSLSWHGNSLAINLGVVR